MAGCTTNCDCSDLVKPVKDGIASQNPVLCQALGICSALAVTGYVSTTLVMGAALLFVASFSGLAISLLRKAIPHRVRLIVQMLVISTLVILVHLYLRAYWFDMSKALGPYVGLIITNCIVMGRAEAFALQNPPILSMVDGMANGFGYAFVLAIIGFCRELLGTGKVMGCTILDANWYTPNQLIILAPGAFFVLGIVIAIFNYLKGPQVEENK